MKNKEIGWILSFLTDGEQTGKQNNKKDFDFLTWSPYDRIIITEVDNFRELCRTTINGSNQKWIGSDQHHIFISN